MKHSNLAERLEEFADVVDGIDSPKPKPPRMLAAVVNAGKPARPRAIPARRRIRIRDQGLQAFRVF
jgi:hypothetical protein